MYQTRFWLGGIIFTGIVLSLPLFFGNYFIHALIIALIFMLPAHGLNLLVGYTGLLSLAQAAFFGIGSYVAALLDIHYATPFYVNLAAAGLVTALIALPLSIPALRLRETSFVMCTLGFVFISQAIAKNWIDLTRGDMGIAGITKPYFALGSWSFSISSVQAFYYMMLAIVTLATLVTYLIVRSPAGRNMVAIRENETLASSLGIDAWGYKLIVFTISAAFAGLGGALYAHYLSVVSPLTFQTYYSILILVIVLVGGAGTITGAILGSLVFVGLTEALRMAPELRMILYGASLLVLVFFAPKGFTPLIKWFWYKVEGAR